MSRWRRQNDEILAYMLNGSIRSPDCGAIEIVCFSMLIERKVLLCDIGCDCEPFNSFMRSTNRTRDAHRTCNFEGNVNESHFRMPHSKRQHRLGTTGLTLQLHARTADSSHQGERISNFISHAHTHAHTMHTEAAGYYYYYFREANWMFFFWRKGHENRNSTKKGFPLAVAVHARCLETSLWNSKNKCNRIRHRRMLDVLVWPMCGFVYSNRRVCDSFCFTNGLYFVLGARWQWTSELSCVRGWMCAFFTKPTWD